MRAGLILCTRCFTPVPAAMLNMAAFTPCPVCAALLRVRVFPALTRPLAEGVTGGRITDAGQAACFFHPHKIAHVPCDACGRFICALCDVELHGEHLCASCVESGRRKGTLTTLEGRRFLWDNVALALAVLPVATLVLWWASIITAPAAILLAIIGWRKPGSLVPRTKVRFVMAIAFSLVVVAGWGVLFFFLATKGMAFE